MRPYGFVVANSGVRGGQNRKHKPHRIGNVTKRCAICYPRFRPVKAKARIENKVYRVR